MYAKGRDAAGLASGLGDKDMKVDWGQMSPTQGLDHTPQVSKNCWEQAGEAWVWG